MLADSYYLPQASSQPYKVCITPPLQSKKRRHSNLPTVGSGSTGVQLRQPGSNTPVCHHYAVLSVGEVAMSQGCSLTLPSGR